MKNTEYLSQALIATEIFLRSLGLETPSAKASMSDLLKVYQLQKSTRGGKWIREKLGNINEAELQSLESMLHHISSFEKAGQSTNCYIACLRLFNWFDCVGNAAMGTHFEPLLAETVSEDLGLRQIRALELIMRALICEVYETDENLECRLLELFNQDIVAKWRRQSDPGEILTGTSFGELATLFAGKEEYPKYDRIFGNNSAEWDQYTGSRRQAVGLFLDDIRRIRNLFAHNKKIGRVQLLLLSAYYEILTKPVEHAYKEGVTSINVLDFMKASREEVNKYLAAMSQDIKDVKDSIVDLNASLSAGQEQIKEALSPILKATPFIATGVILVIFLIVGVLFLQTRQAKQLDDSQNRLHGIQQTADALSNQSVQAGAQLERFAFEFSQLSKDVRASIGEDKLGYDYLMTQHHRDYQDRFINDGGRIEALIDEYRARVQAFPENAMFHYLLARLYQRAGDYQRAEAASLAGIRVDPDYVWNPRTLLYTIPRPDELLKSLLSLEAQYYGITDGEMDALTSGEPQMMTEAFLAVSERLSQKEDTIRYQDFRNRKFSWAWMSERSRLYLKEPSAFEGLVGREAVSSSKLLRLRVLDVKTGYDAIGVINNARMTRLITTSEWDQTVKDRQELKSADLLGVSVMMMPVAVKVEINPVSESASLSSVDGRQFYLMAKTGAHPEPFRIAFPEDADLTIESGVRIVSGSFDVGDFRNGTFWLFFPDMTMLPMQGDESITFNFSCYLKDWGVHINDHLNVSVNSAENLTDGLVDLPAVMNEYSRFSRMIPQDIVGNRITSFWHAQVSRKSDFTDFVEVNLAGKADAKIILIHGPKLLSHQIKYIENLELAHLSWPPDRVGQMLQVVKEGEFVFFTGTIINNSNGYLWIVPNSLVRDFNVLNDNELSSSIIGDWEITVGQVYLVTSYMPGGKVSFTYDYNVNGTTQHIEAAGTWEIRGGYLMGEVDSSSNVEVVPVGHFFADSILEISDIAFRYELSDGEVRTQRRVSNENHIE